MPPILNPLHEDPASEKVASQPKGPPAPKLLAVNEGVRNSGELPEEHTTLKSDIDFFSHEDLQFKKILIETIKARSKVVFNDPFRYVEDTKDQEASQLEHLKEEPA